jgi:hypothetical protein
MPTRTDLLCKAKELGLKGYTAMSKDALEKFVEANMPKTVRVKRIKKKAVEPEPAPAPVKRIKVRKPKVVNPMKAVDDAKKYLEELEQKKIAKGLGKLKKTVSKGIVKSALERAVIKYKLEKSMKNPIIFPEEESIPVKVKRKKKKPLAEQKKFKAGVAKVKETLAKGKAEALLKKAIAKYKAKKADEDDDLFDEARINAEVEAEFKAKEDAEKELEEADNVEDALFALARLNAEGKMEDGQDFETMLDVIEGFEWQFVEAIVEHLREKGKSVRTIVNQMKNMAEGFTMFDDYIEANTSDEEFAKWKKSKA